MKTISQDCSDAELSAVVAQHVAGFTFYTDPFEPPMSRLEVPEKWCYRDRAGTFYVGEPYALHKEAFAEIGLRWGYMWTRPKFATSSNDVLPILEKGSVYMKRNYFMSAGEKSDSWFVHYLDFDETSRRQREGKATAPTLARAACFALLRAHGITPADGASERGTTG